MHRQRVGASLTSRALLSLGLLVGYVVLAAVVVLGLVGISVVAVSNGLSAGDLQLVVTTAVVTVAIARGLFTVERKGADLESDGIGASRSQQPELWSLIDEVAADTGFPVPDDLRFTEDVNAFVHENTRFLGLVGGTTHLGIGTALLQVLTVDELRAVLAHELGHLGGGDTRLSSVVYRADLTLARTVAHLGQDSLLGRLFSTYAGVVRRSSLSVRRGQELTADTAAVSVAGQDSVTSMLRQLQAAGPAWAFFLRSYARPVWRADLQPEDLYDGFRQLVNAPARQEELAALRETSEARSDPYDSHPSTTERMSQAAALPPRPGRGDDRLARELLRDPGTLELAVSSWLHGRVLGPGDRPLVRWDSEEAAEALGLPSRELAAALSAATAEADGGPVPAGLDRTLALLEDDRDVALCQAFTGIRRAGSEHRWDDVVRLVLGPVAAASATSLVVQGKLRWRLSFDTSVQLVDSRNRRVVIRNRLAEALDLEDEEWKAGLRVALTRLKVDLSDDAVPSVAVDREPCLALLSQLSTKRRALKTRRGPRYDAMVTPDRLLAVPLPARKGLAAFCEAMAKQYGIGRGAAMERRRKELLDLRSASPDDLAGRPGTRQWRWDELDGVGLDAKNTKRWPLVLVRTGEPTFILLSTSGRGATSDDLAAMLEPLLGDRLRRV